MISIKINNFMSSACCHSQLYSSKEGFLPITYQFFPGNCYGLISDFGCGSWALATCIGGRCESVVKGSAFVNNHKVRCEELQGYSCFIGEKIIDGINSEQNILSANECIQKALEISKLSFTVEDIKRLFKLSDERFNRDLNSVSGEIYRISIAIGFALNKEVFCYPWINTHDSSRIVDSKDIEVLRKNNKIILIPTCRASQKTPLKKVFNYIINFHSYNESYFNLDIAERKKLKKLKGW